MLKTVRIIAWAALATFVVGAGAVWIYQTVVKSAPPAQVNAGLVAPSTAVGGPFRLVDQTGRETTEKDLAGKPTLIFFGYTFCPDVCPTTLAEAGEWLKALGSDGDRVNVVFVTVDPQRDTPEKLKEYLSAFDPRIRGLTGSPDAVAATLKAYRVYSRRQGEGDSYTMDHSASVYMMDKAGRFVGAIAYQEDEAKALAKIRQLLTLA